MTRKLTPQEKKKRAYEKDHYVSAGESRHAFRKNWPKKKAMLNQKQRHKDAQALHEVQRLHDLDSIENSQNEITANQLRRGNPSEKLQKWGVMSLREFVTRNQEARKSRPGTAARDQGRIEARYKLLIPAFEKNPESVEAEELLRDIRLGGWGLRRFLVWNPGWKTRLVEKLSELKRLEEKAKMKSQKKDLEKRRTKELLRSIQRLALRRRADGLAE